MVDGQARPCMCGGGVGDVLVGFKSSVILPGYGGGGGWARKTRRSQFHKLLHQNFMARFLIILVKTRAFNFETLHMPTDHRIL